MGSLWNWFKGLFATMVEEGNRDEGTDTEFAAEVVRITEILPHTNADKLEIARFEMKSGPAAYEVVIQKGSYKPGDLAVYFSVDCILPLEHPEFAFLATRPDGIGKTHFRLRAARLRGTFSQGLLVTPPPGSLLGDQMAARFDVTYHRDPEPVEKFGPTPGSSKKKSQPWPQYSLESLKKSPNLFELGEEVVVTEKIHGCNFRFGWVRRKFLGIPIGWRFRVGSHRAMKGQGKGGFYGESDGWAEFAKDHDLATVTKNHKGYLFVGELYGTWKGGTRIQDLTYGAKQPELAIFDIRHKGSWICTFHRDAICADINLPQVPVLYRGPYSPELLGFSEGMSTIAPDQIREGVVIESIGLRKKAKYVGQGYLLRKEAA